MEAMKWQEPKWRLHLLQGAAEHLFEAFPHSVTSELGKSNKIMPTGMVYNQWFS